VVLRAEDGHDECTVPFSNSTDRNACLADHDFPPELEESEVVNDDAEDEDRSTRTVSGEIGRTRRYRGRRPHYVSLHYPELRSLHSDCEWRDRDSEDRHGHSELIKLGAAGAGKSGKIGDSLYHSLYQ
jgi:hypothetical protein